MQNQSIFSKRYSIKMITEEHFDEVFSICKNQYAINEPLTQAYFHQLSPQQRKLKIESAWNQKARGFIREVIKCGLSVGCFDLQNKSEIIGIILINGQFVKQTQETIYFPPYIKELEQELFNNVLPKHVEIFREENIPLMEHLIYYIQIQHRGKGLLKKMIEESNRQAQLKNYPYQLCWASNFKTAKTMRGLGYELIGEIDAKQFISKGVCPFKHLPQEHKMQTLWFKDLLNSRRA